jgi:hypothetical protein
VNLSHSVIYINAIVPIPPVMLDSYTAENVMADVRPPPPSQPEALEVVKP